MNLKYFFEIGKETKNWTTRDDGFHLISLTIINIEVSNVAQTTVVQCTRRRDRERKVTGFNPDRTMVKYPWERYLPHISYWSAFIIICYFQLPRKKYFFRYYLSSAVCMYVCVCVCVCVCVSLRLQPHRSTQSFQILA